MNGSVAQVFRPAGSGDFRVAQGCGLESPPNPQPGKAALHSEASLLAAQDGRRHLRTQPNAVRLTVLTPFRRVTSVIQCEKNGVRWELVAGFAPILDEVLRSPGKLIKESPAKVVTRHCLPGGNFYVKRYRHDAVPLRPLKFFFKRSQAKQEWELAHELQRRGVPVVEHVALGERRSRGGLQESILITAGFEGVPLNEAQEIDPSAVLRFIEQLHERGVLHEDLHPANLLVRRDPFELRLVDLHGAKVKDRLTIKERNVNLALLRVAFPIPVAPEVQRSSAQTRQLLLFRRSKRCLRRNREFAFERIGGLRWHVRLPLLTPSAKKILLDPDGFLSETAHILKPGRTSTVGRGDGVVLKRFNFRKPFSLVKDLGRPSRARKAYQQAYHLELAGIPTARCIATADRRICGFLWQAYFLMEEIPGAIDLGTVLRSGCHLEAGLIDQVAELVARLHEEGFSHRDLKESNLVFGNNGVLHVLDLDGLKFVKQLSERRAALDLLRLARAAEIYPAVTRHQRFRFLVKYCRDRRLRSVPRLR
jgi:tRNA A-37 threonylcarbamoyl transferase component Bud32